MQSTKDDLNNSIFLVTGGAGSIGSVLVKTLLERYNPAAIRVFDNSDYLLAKLARTLNDERVRCILGNVQDRHRIDLALQDVDYVFHLAAIKDVSVTEYNPLETITTNILGTAYLIESCLHQDRIKKVVNLSSDKAVGINTLYGATKYIGEQLILWGNQVGSPKMVFSNVRLGNVIETRGNVFEIWEEQKARNEPLTITDPEMRRYFINIQDAANRIISAFELTRGGELFIPIMNEYPIMYFVKDADKDNISIIGVRKGEKMTEALMSKDEYNRAERVGDANELWVVYS